MAVDRERVSALVRQLLEAIGEDPDRPGLRQTPARVADSWTEFFGGVGQDAGAPLQHTISVSRGPAPDTLPSGAVMLRDIAFRSMCEHHLLPFHGMAHVGYIPGGGAVTGLSKLARLVHVYARRPQVQERLTFQIADALMDELGAAGAIVVIEAEHMCMSMRGVRAAGARTITSAVRGMLRDNPSTRSEAMALINGR